MPRRSPRIPGAREPRKRWLPLTGIALLVAMDILLVVLALQSASPRTNGSPAANTPAPSALEPAATTPASPSGGGETTVTPTTPTRILGALDENVAWRATTGACQDAVATPELSVDGGATWTAADLTGATGITALQRIFVTGSDTAAFLGAGSDCTPEVMRTFVAGADFEEDPGQLDGSWYLAPVGSATVHAPGGDVSAPCESAIVVAPLDETRATVLCDDGSLHLTTDTGVSWTALAPLPGAITVTETADGFLVASIGSESCAGVQLTTLGVDDDRTSLGCVESSVSAAELAGSTALDWTDDGIWMWVDERLLISTDEGATWT